MKITKNKKAFNEHKIEKLTEGQLLAIKNALEFQSLHNCLTPVGYDIQQCIIKFLNTQNNI